MFRFITCLSIFTYLAALGAAMAADERMAQSDARAQPAALSDVMDRP